MKDLYSFLNEISQRSSFNAELSKRGGFITFSNSGRRGGTKYFQIGIDSILQTLKDILEHLVVFKTITKYDETPWRDNGSEYFTDPVANANSTVQTKPLFSTLSKIIIWGNQPQLDHVDPDEEIALNETTLIKAINKLEKVANCFMPKRNITNDLNEKPLQQIFYGAPGTGKSFVVDEMCRQHLHHRTTFHPDSDYSTFVGCYKPKSHKKNMISGNGINETQLLSNFFDSNSDKYKRLNKARYLYEALIHTKDIRDLGLDAQMIHDKLTAKGFSGCAYTTEATCMYNIYDWLIEDGYIVENKLSYEFTPQCFIKAYIDAWKLQKRGDPVFLVIEEINRGNCAQIFGDLFQLLDRNDEGFSRYGIVPDTDLQEYISELGLIISDIYDADGNDISGQIANGSILILPNNLHIWATMNTSDQSLFPIDSAFKRRWEWKYMPIKNHEDENYVIEITDTTYNWWGFLSRINQVIGDTTSSEDKKLGYFFVKPNGKAITAEQFVGKVLFYLWNDVFKNYGFDNPIFSKGENKKFEFSDFFQEDGSPNTESVILFLKKLEETIKEETPLKIIMNAQPEEQTDSEPQKVEA